MKRNIFLQFPMTALFLGFEMSKLTDYPMVDAKDYEIEFKSLPLCPQCFSKQVEPYGPVEKKKYLCPKCVVVFKWKN